jgi:hypothetical protein
MEAIMSQPTRLPAGLYRVTRCRTALSIADWFVAAIDKFDSSTHGAVIRASFWAQKIPLTNFVNLRPPLCGDGSVLKLNSLFRCK